MTAIPSSEIAPHEARARTPEVALRDIGGVGVAVLTAAEALATLDRALAARRHRKLAFCNAHLVNLAFHDAGLRARLAGFLVLPDGVGVDLGGRLLHGARFPANLNGTDFIPALLAAQLGPLRVMLLGGRPGVAQRAAERLASDHPAHAFAVLGHGYFAPGEEAALLARLERERPDLLLVAFGAPRQESWIAECLDERHVTVAAGVGALFDFLAGEVARAPGAVRRLRLEWLYRLWLEPGRLWRRYVLGNPLFLWRMLRLRLSGRRTGR